mgnify:CR=1 FL=1
MAHLNQEEIIAEVKRNNEIVSVVSEYVTLKEKGRSHLGLCPFHQEKTPSFTVSKEKQLYHCFGCGAGGDVISFIMQLENLSFPQALRFLAERANLAVSLSGLETSDMKKAKQVQEWVFRLHHLAAAYYKKVLFDPAFGEKARVYLQERGINPQTIEKFLLGYAPPSWTALVELLRKKGIPLAQAEKAGLVIGGAEGFYNRFRDRLVFPIMTAQGRVAAFGARIMGEGRPKYLNSPDTPVFHKGKYLYGLYQARGAIRAEGKAVIVEGYLDVIQAHQSGIEYVVASLGTALTRDQIKTLKRYTQNVVIAYDADSPGQAATVRGLDLLRQEGVNIRVAILPGGDDPDSLIKREGKEAFEQIIAKAKDLFSFKLEYLLQHEEVSTVEGKAQAVKRILPLLAEVNSVVAREAYIKIMAQEIGVSEEAIYIEWRSYWDNIRKNKQRLDIKQASRYTKPDLKQPSNAPHSSDSSQSLSVFSNTKGEITNFQLEREVLRGCLQEKNNLERIKEALSGIKWSNPQYKALFENLLHTAEESGDWPPTESGINPELRRIFTEILAENELSSLPVDLDGCYRQIKRNQLIREIQQVQKEIAVTTEEKEGKSLSSGELQEKLFLLNELHKQLRQEFPSFSGLI